MIFQQALVQKAFQLICALLPQRNSFFSVCKKQLDLLKLFCKLICLWNPQPEARKELSKVRFQSLCHIRSFISLRISQNKLLISVSHQTEAHFLSVGSGVPAAKD